MLDQGLIFSQAGLVLRPAFLSDPFSDAAHSHWFYIPYPRCFTNTAGPTSALPYVCEGNSTGTPPGMGIIPS